MTSDGANARPPPFWELLDSIGEAQEPQDTGSVVADGSGIVEGTIGSPNPDGYNNAPSPRVDLGQVAKIDGHARVYLRSDSSTFKERGGQQRPLTPPPISRPGLQSRTPTLREKPGRPISALLSPPPLGTVLSPISNTQREPNSIALEETGAGPSNEGKEKADIADGHTGDEHERDRDGTATGRIGLGDSFKRTADNTDLNERAGDVPRLEKVQRIGQSAGPNRYIPRLMILERSH